jgi:tRNA (Thr-GGU) A37 N-methylase
MSSRKRRSFTVRPIGYVRTPHTELELTPTQSLRNPLERARLIVFPEYAAALAGLEEFEYAH